MVVQPPGGCCVVESEISLLRSAGTKSKAGLPQSQNGRSQTPIWDCQALQHSPVVVQKRSCRGCHLVVQFSHTYLSFSFLLKFEIEIIKIPSELRSRSCFELFYSWSVFCFCPREESRIFRVPQIFRVSTFFAPCLPRSLVEVNVRKISRGRAEHLFAISNKHEFTWSSCTNVFTFERP